MSVTKETSHLNVAKEGLDHFSMFSRVNTQKAEIEALEAERDAFRDMVR